MHTLHDFFIYSHRGRRGLREFNHEFHELQRIHTKEITCCVIIIFSRQGAKTPRNKWCAMHTLHDFFIYSHRGHRGLREFNHEFHELQRIHTKEITCCVIIIFSRQGAKTPRNKRCVLHTLHDFFIYSHRGHRGLREFCHEWTRIFLGRSSRNQKRDRN